MISRNKETIQNLRRAMEFYQELGFKYLPLKKADFTSSMAEMVSDISVEYGKPEDADAGTLAKADRLKSVRKEIGDCHRCGLSKGRKNIVFGEGNPDSELMFIGEGPGREEDIQARPFVGDAGKVLTSLIEKMGFKREDVYIANIVKCRPPGNRDPEEDEMASCSQFLERQIEVISPKVIVALGRISSHRLLGTKTPISRLRGSFYDYKGIPVMPTFHPAYLMRNPKDKWLTWDDAQHVLKRLNN